MRSIWGEDGTLTAMQASGPLTSGDRERFVPAPERIAREVGPVRMPVQLEGSRGWGLPALRRGLELDAIRRSKRERIAVGGEAREAMGTRLPERFLEPEMRLLHQGNADAARRWPGGPAGTGALDILPMPQVQPASTRP